jgi:hypothetical protein
MSAEGQLSSAAPWPERWKGRAKPSISRLRQKNQVGFNSDTGAKGAKRRTTEASAAKARLERSAVAEPSMETVVGH